LFLCVHLICIDAAVELEELGTSIPNPPTKEVDDNGTLFLVLFVAWTSCCFHGIRVLGDFLNAYFSFIAR
jgi:hypothetical protein